MSIVQGSKGSKGGGSQRTPVEAANTLRSTSKGRILDLIVHGPIQGLADGLKSVFLDDTPLQNADDSFNFEGVSVVTREGYPDQEIIPGFRAVENPHDVSTEVKFGAPVVRALTNQDADAVIVSIRLNSLSKQDRKTGDLNGHKVTVSIQVRVDGGGWFTARADTISGKTTSAYQRSYRIDFPNPGAWEVRVVRDSPDEADSYGQSSTFWSDMTEVVDARLNYPDSALVGIEVDAKLFGNQMPSRSYDMKLSIIKVPSNYNPDTRAYTGLWDGSFKLAWTDNPAWCYYDLATHPVIGAGLTGVDKWALYQIGRYCDELVPDGFGSTEPRFTLNTLFAERTEAITTLTTLASVFRGMTYWGTNTVVPVGDQPTDPRKLVGPANVINGEFEYSGTSLKERHSVAIVMWNDPADSGKAKPELVEDPESIDLFGWKEVTVTAFGCTSRGQANRLGRWILYSERMETETVSYTAVSDQADLRPGDIIEISDPYRAGVRLSGRVITPGVSTLVLDKAPTEASGSAWFISVMMPDGVVQRRGVISFDGHAVTLVSPLTSTPIPGAMWILSSMAAVPPQYRVASVSEQEDGSSYAILATEYDPRKYDIVEKGLTLPDVVAGPLSGPVAPPVQVVVSAHTYTSGDIKHQAVSISWESGGDSRASGYLVQVWGPLDTGWRTSYVGDASSVDELNAANGQWRVRVKATSARAPDSKWASRTVDVEDLLLPFAPDSVTVEAHVFDISLRPVSASRPTAVYEFWRSDLQLPAELITTHARRITVGSELLDVGLSFSTTYNYYIRGVNSRGVSGWFFIIATTQSLENYLAGLIGKSQLASDLLKPIEDAQAVVDVAVNKLNGLIADVQTGLLEVAAERYLREDQDAVTTAAVEVVTNEVGSAKATIALVMETATTEAEAVSRRFDAVVASVDDAMAAVVDESVARASAIDAEAAKTSALTARVGSAESSISNAQTAVSDLSSSTSTSINTLSSRIGGVSAAVTSESLTRASENSAMGSRVDTVQATANSAVSSAQITQTAVNDINDSLAASITLKTQITQGGRRYLAGLALGVEEVGGVIESQILLSADRLAFIHETTGDIDVPFAVVGSKTYIRSAFIKDADINTLKIAGNAVIIPVGSSGGTSDLTVLVTLDGDYPVFIQGALTQSYFSVIRLTRNGLLLWAEQPAQYTLASRGVIDHPGPGTHSYRLWSDNANNTNNTSISIMVLKR